jgi:kynurenine formamidase
MANLDKVPAKGALIVVTWPKVKNGLGFPARAFAILPKRPIARRRPARC